MAAPLLGLLFVTGWRYGAIAPLSAAATLLLATLDSSRGQVFHTEHLLVLQMLVLAVAPAADVLAIGRRPATPGPAADGRCGWPVRLAAAVVVVAYVIARIAKLRIGDLDWLDGDTLRNWVAHDNLRKAVLGDSYSPIGRYLVGHPWLFPPLAVLTMIVELGAGVALLGGRWRTAWVIAAWLFHLGVLALMAIVFPYQLSGVALAPLFRLERLADRMGTRRWRDRAWPSCPTPGTRRKRSSILLNDDLVEQDCPPQVDGGGRRPTGPAGRGAPAVGDVRVR